MIISHIPKPNINITKITIKKNIIEIMPVINENKRITKSVFYKLIFPNTRFSNKDMAAIILLEDHNKKNGDFIAGSCAPKPPAYPQKRRSISQSKYDLLSYLNYRRMYSEYYF
jgi:hypothetical protein